MSAESNSSSVPEGALDPQERDPPENQSACDALVKKSRRSAVVIFVGAPQRLPRTWTSLSPQRICRILHSPRICTTGSRIPASRLNETFLLCGSCLPIYIRPWLPLRSYRWWYFWGWTQGSSQRLRRTTKWSRLSTSAESNLYRNGFGAEGSSWRDCRSGPQLAKL